jgi:murein DD-endopeptidase MepM/ murein hydrolase activator NlpD
VRSAWTETTRRRVLFGALALCWLLLGVFGLLGLPAFVVVLVLGLIAFKTLEPDGAAPTQTIVASKRNVVLGFAALAAFVPLAAGPGLLLGTMNVDLVLTLAGALSAVVLALALAAETTEGAARARLGKRELVLTLTVLLAFVASYHAGDLFLAMVAVAVVLPTVLLAQRVRHARTEDLEPGLLRRLPYAAQAANVWLFAGLLGAASLPGTFALYEFIAPDSHRTIVLAFWIGLAVLALLALVPRRRISLAFNFLVALGSLFLVLQLVEIERGPEDAVAIDLPFEGVWFVASGGRSPLVNGHYPLRVQRHALDLFQVRDGKTHRGGADLLTNYYSFGKRLLAPGDGKVMAVIDTRPDAPVGDSDLEHPEGNIVVVDIGDGRYVLYAHLKQGTARVRVGDRVVSGQDIGLVGDSGNSDEPHLHVQVQSSPTFEIGNDDLETFPILFRDTIVIRDDAAHPRTTADVRRGDQVGGR